MIFYMRLKSDQMDRKTIPEGKYIWYSARKIPLPPEKYDKDAPFYKNKSKKHKQYIELSEFMRGRVYSTDDYRLDPLELFADAGSSVILQPSFTKKNFPLVYQEVKKRFDDVGLKL